jgi:hypothetical protein
LLFERVEPVIGAVKTGGGMVELASQARRFTLERGRGMISVGTERVGSGLVVAIGLVLLFTSTFLLIRVVGWDPTWRAFGVTPLQPPFFDMHVINDYAACALQGVDPYAPKACNVDNFNIPRAWLWTGHLGIDGSDSVWLSICLIVFTATIITLLLRGRSWQHGVLALATIACPSVMMGVERGNLDLLILALVGAAALAYDETRIGRLLIAAGFVYVGILLKLIPIFCIALAARFSKATLIFAFIVAISASIYLVLMLDDILLIRRNVPITFVLSYGYKAIFLGLDHIRAEAGLSPLGLADTWLPAAVAAVVGILALLIGATGVPRKAYSVDSSAAGTAFLFGAGIYCATFLLGTNFDYRLMFLLLCVPQLLDWQLDRSTAGALQRPRAGLYYMVLGVLWLNGSSDGHSLFLLMPQVLDWSLFAYLTAVLMATLLRTATSSLLLSREGSQNLE